MIDRIKAFREPATIVAIVVVLVGIAVTSGRIATDLHTYPLAHVLRGVSGLYGLVDALVLTVLTLACVLTNVCNSQVGQTAIQVGGTAVFARFSRQDEAEADEEGIRNTVRAGISPNGVPEMFQILINERKSNPSAVEGFFATHPLEEDRIAASKALIATYDPAIIRSLGTDSRNYQTFKARVHSLPPSPTPRPQ